ncbi:Ubiquitin-associated protein 1, partial [Stegodyphus mimosarum]
MTSETASTSKAKLRGCKSYSDICNLSELETAYATEQERSRTPPSNIFPTEVSEPLINKMDKNDHSHFTNHENASSNGILNSDSNVSKPFGLPDPYYELDDNERQVVDSITDMGFSRGQVARTVKHLGMDEKKVVEHLCQIQMLEESGYDSLEAEAALHLHDYNRDQAKVFLDLLNKFQDLGFEKNAIKKALVQNKNDWN